jgi:hypothetical protein
VNGRVGRIKVQTKKAIKSAAKQRAFVLDGLIFSGAFSGVLDPYCEFVMAVETRGVR